MTLASHHARITALFAEALERAPEERDAWLATACDDPETRREVAAMLAWHTDDTPGPLDRPILARPKGDDAAGDTVDPLLGQRIGAWNVTDHARARRHGHRLPGRARR